MILRRVMFRSIRRLYELARADPVDPELRGWSWDRLPLKPRAYLNLGVSEIASKYCETRRDIWLRRKTGARAEPTEPILTLRTVQGPGAFKPCGNTAWKPVGEGLWARGPRAR